MIIGIDAHKRVHQAVAIDEAGRAQGQCRADNTAAGWDTIWTWATALGAARAWGIEGAGQYGRGLAQFLLAAGEIVVEVNPRLTVALRTSDKSDRADALAVARVVLRDAATLPRLQAEDATAVLAVLVAEREEARAEATRIRNQLHEVLLQLSFVDDQPWPALTDADAVATLEAYQAPGPDPLSRARAAGVRRLAARLSLALRQTAALGQEIGALARQPFAPLLALVGVAPLMAGMLAAHLGGHSFATDAQLAKYAGVAPLDASSGAQTRHRLNRTGDRQLNALFHRIALVQSRCYPPAQAYLARRLAEGKTRKEALRALTRYLARAVFRAWQQCVPPPLLPTLT